MRTVIWNIDFKCNLLCKGCNAFEGNVLFPKDKIEEFVDEMKYNKVKIVSVTGGEPTLHPDLPRILKTLKEHKFKTHIATNGTNKYVLSKIYPYLDAATISLDSHIPDLLQPCTSEHVSYPANPPPPCSRSLCCRTCTPCSSLKQN